MTPPVAQSPLFGIHVLENGRKYRFHDTGREYTGGEYPEGGIHIACWDDRIHRGDGGWLYISNSPDEECARGFLRLAARLATLPSGIAPVVERKSAPSILFRRCQVNF